jgi:hypothetical protein
MLRFVNVATPLLAANVVVPLRVPLPGLFAIAIVMDALEEVMVLPEASSTVTCTLGIVAPAEALPGC